MGTGRGGTTANPKDKTGKKGKKKDELDTKAPDVHDREADSGKGNNTVDDKVLETFEKLAVLTGGDLNASFQAAAEKKAASLTEGLDDDDDQTPKIPPNEVIEESILTSSTSEEGVTEEEDDGEDDDEDEKPKEEVKEVVVEEKPNETKPNEDGKKAVVVEENPKKEVKEEDDDDDDDDDKPKKKVPEVVVEAKPNATKPNVTQPQKEGEDDDDDEPKIVVKDDKDKPKVVVKDDDDDEDNRDPVTKNDWIQYATTSRIGKAFLLKYLMVEKYKTLKAAGVFEEDDNAVSEDLDEDEIDEINEQAREDEEMLNAIVEGKKKREEHGVVASDDEIEVRDDDYDPLVDYDIASDRRRRDDPLGILGEDDSDEDDEVQHSPPSSGLDVKIMDGINKAIGIYNDLNTVTTVGSMIMGLEEVGKTDEQIKEIRSEGNHDRARKAHGYLNLIGQVGALGGNALAITSDSVKYSRTKSQRRKRELRFDMVRNSLVGVANAGKIINTGIGLWGDAKDKDQANTVASFSVINPFFSFAGSVCDLIGSITDKKTRKRMIGELRGTNYLQHARTDKEQKAILQRLKKRAQLKGADTEKKLKKHTNAIKARKYALQQAADFNEVYANAPTRSIMSSIITAGTLVSSVAQLILGKNSAIGGVLKAVTPFFGGFLGVCAKYGEKSTAEDTQKSVEAKKKKVLTDHLEDKDEKVQSQAETLFGNRADSDDFIPLTKQESYNISFSRLSDNIHINMDDDTFTKEQIDIGFNALNKKRAKYIAESDKESRREFLHKLRLDDDATYEDIERALIGV